MEKYRNKYRIPSARLQNWDYRWAGAYFVTICTQGRIHFFGEISDQQMQLSEIGKIVESEWLKTFELRPDMNLTMGAYVVMPNQFAPQSKNLASIIRGFKSSVTVNARKINPCFGWQSRFHDHIVRNDGSFQRITNYIVNNPQKWQDDSFNSQKTTKSR